MAKRAEKARRAKAGTSAAAAAHRRQVFVEAYIANGGNATQAAIDAGFSPKTADQQGARLLKDVRVSAEIEKRQNQLADRYALRNEDIFLQLGRIANVDPAMLYDRRGKRLAVHKLPEAIRTAIASIEYDDAGRLTKIRFWSKTTALDMAMKHRGLYERDNQQRTDPIKELLQLVSGAHGSRGVDHVKGADR